MQKWLVENTTGIIKSKYMSMKIGVGNPVTCCNKKREARERDRKREQISVKWFMRRLFMLAVCRRFFFVVFLFLSPDAKCQIIININSLIGRNFCLYLFSFSFCKLEETDSVFSFLFFLLFYFIYLFFSCFLVLLFFPAAVLENFFR